MCYERRRNSSQVAKKKIHVSPGKSVRGIHFGEEAVVSSDEEDKDDPAPESSLVADNLAESSVMDMSSDDSSPDEEHLAAPLPSSDDEMEIADENVAIDDEISDAEPAPITITGVKKDMFVIVTMKYSTGSRNKKEHLRKYLGQVREVRRSENEVEISFLKKYFNRDTDFIFVTPYNEENVEVVPLEEITEIVNIPFTHKRGHFIFNTHVPV